MALFAAMALAQDIAPDWMAVNALWLSFSALGGVSIGSLLAGRPWTTEYSRAAYLDSVSTPQFWLINAAPTGLWGVLFLVLGLCRWAGVAAWITTGIVAAGALVSIFGPRLAIRYLLQRMRAWLWKFN